MLKIKIFGILLPIISFGQSVDQNVISSSGNHFNNGTVQISYTIGEPLTNTLTGLSNKLTQGFHQSNWQISGVENYNPIIEISVYPNPMCDQLNIETEFFEGVGYTLYDATGKLIIKGNLDKPITQIETANLNPAEYSLSVNGKNQSSLRIYKLIKTK